MQISDVITQLRTTDLAASIRFYTALPGFTLAFQYDDFYAGIRAGPQLFHLKLVEYKGSLDRGRGERRPFAPVFRHARCEAAAEAVRQAGVQRVKEVHRTPWGTQKFVVHDDQGHTLYFGEAS